MNNTEHTGDDYAEIRGVYYPKTEEKRVHYMDMNTIFRIALETSTKVSDLLRDAKD
jgi:hypothetical protein